MIAATCPLVNIVTRLRGPALRFYRICSPQQRANYTLLTSPLKQRLTPVRIQAVQSSRFHERKQGAKESVDSYAQDLLRLFNQAYSSASASGDCDQMRLSVLAYQFVAVLKSELKAKLVGHKGTSNYWRWLVLRKLQFRDFVQQKRTTRRNKTPSSGPPPTGGIPQQKTSTFTSMRPQKTVQTCYNCGATGHIAAFSVVGERRRSHQARCKDRLKATLTTARSKTSEWDIFNPDRVSGDTSSPVVSDVLDQALVQAMTMLFGISPTAKDRDSAMGPTVTSQPYLDGTPTAALVDTRSPVTIVSLDFFLKAAAAKKEPGQTPTAWREAVKQRLQPATMSLQSYGGADFDIIGQALCRISVRKHRVEAVQPNAPMELLLGTDTLHKVGFALTQDGF